MGDNAIFQHIYTIALYQHVQFNIEYMFSQKAHGLHDQIKDSTPPPTEGAAVPISNDGQYIGLQFQQGAAQVHKLQ